MKYVEKRPIVIDAFKFTGSCHDIEGFDNISMCHEEGICTECKESLNKHSILDSHYLICPNTYIIKNTGGIQLMSSDNFEAIYKPMYTDVTDVNFKEIS